MYDYNFSWSLRSCIYLVRLTIEWYVDEEKKKYAMTIF